MSSILCSLLQIATLTENHYLYDILPMTRKTLESYVSTLNGNRTNVSNKNNCILINSFIKEIISYNLHIFIGFHPF